MLLQNIWLYFFLHGRAYNDHSVIIKFIVDRTFIPMIRPFPSFIDMYGVTSNDLMSELYFNHPFWYIF